MLTYNKWREKYYSYSRMNSQKEIYFWGNLIPLSPIEIKWSAPNQGGGNGSVSLSALLMLATQNPKWELELGHTNERGRDVNCKVILH